MKMTCVHCAEITNCSCSEDHAKEFPNAKYICDVCMELLDKGVKESELKTSPQRKEVERDMIAEGFADYFSEELAQSFFETYWGEVKTNIREMSKKDLAKITYQAGAHIAIVLSSKMALDKKLDEAIREATNQQEAKP